MREAVSYTGWHDYNWPYKRRKPTESLHVKKPYRIKGWSPLVVAEHLLHQIPRSKLREVVSYLQRLKRQGETRKRDEV